MKIQIEVYKGYQICYDDDTDKFVCEMVSDENKKQTNRMKLTDVRKEVDQFIKLNMNFKPFKALWSQYGDSFEEVEFVALRTDGKLVKRGIYRNEFVGSKDINHVFNYDEPLMKEYDVAKAAKNEADKIFSKKRQELVARLKPMDLSKFDLK